MQQSAELQNPQPYFKHFDYGNIELFGMVKKAYTKFCEYHKLKNGIQGYFPKSTTNGRFSKLSALILFMKKIKNVSKYGIGECVYQFLDLYRV